MTATLEIFTAKSGQQSAKVVYPTGKVKHLHSLVHPEEEKKYYCDVDIWGNVLVLLGTGFGYHLESILNRIHPLTSVIAIDFYPQLLSAFAQRCLQSLPNPMILLSPEDLQAKQGQIHSILQNTGRFQVIKHPASFQANPEFYQSVLEMMYRQTPKTSAKLENRKTKTLVFADRFFMEQEIIRAMKQMGAETTTFSYEQQRGQLEFESNLEKAVQLQKPDFLISVNMNGFDGQGFVTNLSKRYSIPVVVWFVDDPHPILLSKKLFINNNMLAFSWEKAYLPYLEKAGFIRALPLPLATDPSVMSGSHTSFPTIDLGFVGSSMGSTFLEQKIKSKFLWSESYAPLSQSAAAHLLQNPGVPIDNLVRDHARRVGIQIELLDQRNFTWLCSYVIHLASMMKRLRLVNSLRPFGIQTIGDPQGWQDLAGTTITCRPDVAYGPVLAQTYRSIRINVNSTSCQMPNAVNQRVFDIPMAGAFLITDDQKDMQDLFEKGKETVCYDSLEDLIEKVQHYRKNDQDRTAVVKNAQKRIAGQHTCVHRVQKIVKTLSTR